MIFSVSYTFNIPVYLVKCLINIDIFVSVCDDHLFKDEMLFYRFRLDDNTMPITHDIELVLKGYGISQR